MANPKERISHHNPIVHIPEAYQFVLGQFWAFGFEQPKKNTDLIGGERIADTMLSWKLSQTNKSVVALDLGIVLGLSFAKIAEKNQQDIQSKHLILIGTNFEHAYTQENLFAEAQRRLQHVELPLLASKNQLNLLLRQKHAVHIISDVDSEQPLPSEYWVVANSEKPWFIHEHMGGFYHARHKDLAVTNMLSYLAPDGIILTTSYIRPELLRRPEGYMTCFRITQKKMPLHTVTPYFLYVSKPVVSILPKLLEQKFIIEKDH